MKNINWFIERLPQFIILPIIIVIVVILNPEKYAASHIKAFLHITLQSILIYGILSITDKYKYLKVIFVIFIIIPVATNLTYRAFPSVGMMFSIFDTSYDEAYGFFRFNLLEIIISISLFFGLIFLPINTNKNLKITFLLVGASYIAVPSFLFAFGAGKVPSSYMRKDILMGMTKFEAKIDYVLSEEMAHRFPPLKDIKAISDTIDYLHVKNNGYSSSWSKVEATKSSPNLLIIGLGESLRADHLGIYGYERDTTPLLSAMRDKLYIYKNAYSGGTNTWTSVPSMFTKFNSSPDLSKSIINLANDAGYKTFWISNQTEFNSSSGEMIVSSLAKQSGHTSFTTNSDEHEIKYDEVLLPKLVDVLKNRKPNEKTLIVLHFFGSHFEFKDRYPVGYSKYNGGKSELEKTVNQYDNTVFYTDYILSQILKISSEYNAKFIFFSDHGLGNPKGEIPLKHDVRDKPDIDSIHVPLISNSDLGPKLDKNINLFYFECIFSKWSGITVKELNKKYCEDKLNANEIVFYDANLKLNKIRY